MGPSMVGPLRGLVSLVDAATVVRHGLDSPISRQLAPLTLRASTVAHHSHHSGPQQVPLQPTSAPPQPPPRPTTVAIGDGPTTAPIVAHHRSCPSPHVAHHSHHRGPPQVPLGLTCAPPQPPLGPTTGPKVAHQMDHQMDHLNPVILSASSYSKAHGSTGLALDRLGHTGESVQSGLARWQGRGGVRGLSTLSSVRFLQEVEGAVPAEGALPVGVRASTEGAAEFKEGWPSTHFYLPPTKPEEKRRVVVLGTGWAACRFVRELDTRVYDIVCVSPRNHMVFTPLLASTTVGTLEFRSVTEPVEGIQPAIARLPNSHFYLGLCQDVDPRRRQILCRGVVADDPGVRELAGPPFVVSYDKLVMAVGAEASTFGIPGVKENAIFLREVSDAVKIRRKVLLNLMRTELPGMSDAEKSKLLHVVVVGGGPTGVEFSGELSDFIRRDVAASYRHVEPFVHVTLVEASEILSSFDDSLRKYATNQLEKSGVRLVQGVVREVHPEKLVLSSGQEMPYGTLVWSTGVGPSPLVRSLGLEKSPKGRISVDEHLKVTGVEDVYAMGDCAGYAQSTGKEVLPALAQVAERQGKYLAKCFNTIGRSGGSAQVPPFEYRHIMSMATIGRYKALVDLRQSKEAKGLSLHGFVSWFIWRSAYLTRLISWRNRLYVAVNWATTLVFGRDTSRI